MSGCVLVPHQPRAHWYRLVSSFRIVHRWQAGADLFRELQETKRDLALSGFWKRDSASWEILQQSAAGTEFASILDYASYRAWYNDKHTEAMAHLRAQGTVESLLHDDAAQLLRDTSFTKRIIDTMADQRAAFDQRWMNDRVREGDDGLDVLNRALLWDYLGTTIEERAVIQRLLSAAAE